ncbi:NXPE family member 3-like [Synchiropus splendidus]|uniref:NXPE family member 3-like n=1 Tax=Synchiropus splendidus TaxID=270530 RepID=UPI00237D6C1D|nr:NXPE family member 3-like [Synchiropus splendidus]
MKKYTKIEGKGSHHKCAKVCMFGVVVFFLVLLSRMLDNKGQTKPPPPLAMNAMKKAGHNIVAQTSQAVPPKDVAYCRVQPHSLQDAVEERHLLESNVWPQTPSVPENFSLSETSNPRGSNFIILPKDVQQQWHVGDDLKVLIKMKDFKGNLKKTGGDFITARLHNQALQAGVTGKVVDHLNGSYSAVFPLLWKGMAEVEVTLIHTSEAITVLRRITQERPDRIKFMSIFRQGKKTEMSTCNICLRATKEPICNYTDIKTGDPWFCYKPKTLDCDTRTTHTMYRFTPEFGPYTKLFQSKVNMKVFIPPSGAARVSVLPKEIRVYNSPKISQPGYYYQGVWRTLSGPPVQQFNTPTDIGRCLQNKMLFLYGDSTVRQWYEYLTATIKDLKPFNINSMAKVGPYMAVDYQRNTIVRFQIHSIPLVHGPPPVPVAELRYIANELDTLVGGANTVVVIGVWAHFGPFPTEFYIRRLQSIRRSVVRLLNRAPDTLVVVRTSNLRYLTTTIAWTNSDFATVERDKILRAVFKGVNVRWVDAWDMTLAHYLPHELHPKPPIIRNMVNVLLSYICPGH